MNKNYQAIAQSQEKLQTNLKTSYQINYEDSYFTTCIPFRSDLISYASQQTPSMRKVMLFIAGYNNYSKPLYNAFIADRCGVSISTVKRATRKMQVEGFFTKEISADNNGIVYKFDNNARESISEFITWYEKQPEPQQCVYISHGILIDHKNKKVAKVEYDPPISNIKRLNLFNVEDDRARGGAEARPGLGQPCSLSTSLSKTRLNMEHFKTDITKGLVTDNTKDFKKRRDTIKKLTRIWELNEVEAAKMTLFPVEVLEKAYKVALYILQRDRSDQEVIGDRLGWLYNYANKYAYHVNRQHEIDDSFFKAYCLERCLDPDAILEARPITIMPPKLRCPPHGRRDATSDNLPQGITKDGDVVHGSKRRPGSDSEYSPNHYVKYQAEPTQEEKKVQYIHDAEVLTKELITREKTAEIKDEFYLDFLKDILGASLKLANETDETTLVRASETAQS